MRENNFQVNYELPTIGKLIKSTVLAVFIAAAILLIVVLPAEYGLDPTGVGEVIGLKKMGEIKAFLAREAMMESESDSKGEMITQEKAAQAVSETATAGKKMGLRKDKFTIALEPNEGKEIKLTMSKGDSVNYSWYTDGGIANFDAHADSRELQIKYHNYEKGRIDKSAGVLVAAFDGNHGWFWRNRNLEAMVVTLEVSGDYTDVLKF